MMIDESMIMLKSYTIWYGEGGLSDYETLFECIPMAYNFIDQIITERKELEDIICTKEFKDIIIKPNYKEIIIIFSEKEYYYYKKIIKSQNNQTIRAVSVNSWVSYLLLHESDVLLKPPHIRIECSTLCQLSCPSCYMRTSDYSNIGKGYLKYNDFEKLVNENLFIKSIELSNNGEVFLNPELNNILKYAYEKNIDITISNGTNFNFVDEEVLESLVKYKVKHITISIDGVSQNVYAQYRINGNIYNVIDNIRQLNNLKTKYKSDKPELTWQYILMKHNESEIDAAKELSEQLGMNIKYKLDWSGEYEPVNPDHVRQITGLDCFNRKSWFKEKGRQYAYRMCRQMIFQPQLNYDGTLLGCCGNYLADWGENAFDSGLIQALNSDNYKQAISDMIMGTYNTSLDKICRNCTAKLYRGENHNKLILTRSVE